MGDGTSAWKGKRIGIVWAREERLTKISVRYERYIIGFRALGCEAFAVCVASAAEGFTEPVVIAPSLAALRDVDYLRSLRLDATVVVTWLGLGDLVRALEQACPWVISIADSDGQVGVRSHPRATLSQSIHQHHAGIDRIRAGKFWLQKFLFGPRVYEIGMLESVGHSNIVAMCSPKSKDHLAEFFRYYRRSDLEQRIAVIPYPVDQAYLNSPVPLERGKQVVAIGRWDDPQKDAPFLAATIEQALAADAALRFYLVGPGGEAVFAPLCKKHPQVRYLHSQPPEVVADLLRASRCLLLSSRWESGPIVANEALCLGCTLVGPVWIPSFASFCEQGYASVCSRRSAAALAAALRQEMEAWDQGRRHPSATSSLWRRRFNPRTVCAQLLNASDLPCD